MPEPKSHADRRPWPEQIARHIPGFRGYLEKSYRRESDALTRELLADRLDAGKRALDRYSRDLADAKQLGALPACDRLRGAIDRVIGRIRGAMQGYSGFFDLVKIDEAVLDRVYAHDLGLVDEVDAIGASIESLDAKDAASSNKLDDVRGKVDELDRAWQKRSEILQGVD